MSNVPKPLTGNDNKLLCNAFQSLKDNAVLEVSHNTLAFFPNIQTIWQIDYDKLAKAMGMINPRSASNAMVSCSTRSYSQR